MTDLVYWATRSGLVIAWLLAAALAWRRRQGSGRFATGTAVLATLFASMRAWPWNYWLLECARSGLRQAGAYDDRQWFKMALAVALLVVVVLGGLRLRWVLHDPIALCCCMGLGLQGLLLAMETMSLDDMLPPVLVSQPGRYLAEGASATLVLLSLVRMGKCPGSEKP